ncbi:MAG TPA: phosphatidylglycerophosphatase A [Bryobacteraceae bacterium]|nr:phosphatidylglycerophosphatase A [Bryobacteraceae bacterium]
MKSTAWLISTWFGCGSWPWGPGTAGSLGGLIVTAGFVWSGLRDPWQMAGLAALFTPIGIWASTVTARSMGKKDPGEIVVDEVLGQWVTLAAVPVYDWKWILAAFVLFRLFDITKPWPVRKFESLPEGTGIVADDLAAGVYGALVLLGVRWLNH